MLTAEICINLATKNIFQTYTYAVPEKFNFLERGWRVIVPFGKKFIDGFIIEVKDTDETFNFELKEIFDVVDSESWFTPQMFSMASWIADFYLCPLAQAMSLFMAGRHSKKIAPKFETFIKPAENFSEVKLTKTQGVGDFCGGVAEVDIVERLVVDELIDGGGVLHIFLDDLCAPMWPVVALEDHIGLVCELALSLKNVVAPSLCIAHSSTTQGVEVVEGSCAVLCHPKGTIVREVGVHLGRSFRARRELEGDGDAIDSDGLILLHFVGWWHQREGRVGALTHTDTHRHTTRHTLGQVGAILISGTTRHRSVAIGILSNHVLHETSRRDDSNLAWLDLLSEGQTGISNVLGVDDSTHTTIVVSVAVADEDGHDARIGIDIALEKIDGSLSHFLAHQHIEDHPSVLGLDEGHVSHIIATHLIDAFAHLEETCLHRCRGSSATSWD